MMGDQWADYDLLGLHYWTSPSMHNVHVPIVYLLGVRAIKVAVCTKPDSWLVLK